MHLVNGHHCVDYAAPSEIRKTEIIKSIQMHTRRKSQIRDGGVYYVIIHPHPQPSRTFLG
jgi:hypothetical protein